VTNDNPTLLKIQVLWVVMLHHWTSTADISTDHSTFITKSQD